MRSRILAVLGATFASVGLLITLWAWLGQDLGRPPADSNPVATGPSPTGGATSAAPSPTRPGAVTGSPAPPVQRIEIVVVPGTPNQATVNQAPRDDVEPDWASRLAGILTSLGTLLVGVASVAALRKARSAEQAASAATASVAAAASAGATESAATTASTTARGTARPPAPERLRGSQYPEEPT